MKTKFYFYLFIGFCLILGFTFSLSGLDNPNNTGIALMGDANGDREITIVDALIVARFYVGLSPGQYNPNTTDVNYDGVRDIVDALTIARYFVGLESTFTADSVYNQFQVQLNTEKAKWEWERADEYIFECDRYDSHSNITYTFIVKVAGSNIVSIKEKLTNTPLPAEDFHNFFTINRLFEIFQTAIDLKLLVRELSTGAGPVSELRLPIIQIITRKPAPTPQPTPTPTPAPNPTPTPLTSLPPLCIYFPYQFKAYWFTMF